MYEATRVIQGKGKSQTLLKELLQMKNKSNTSQHTSRHFLTMKIQKIFSTSNHAK